jgi:hypothetical protein
MKRMLLGFLALFLPLAASAAVSVEWVNPDTYRDAYSSVVKSEKNRQAVLDDLQKFIIETATPRLAEGQNLKISVTQLDLSGEYEPWVKDHENTRIIKSPYFGHISFNFTLTDAKGNIVKQDEVKLTNQLMTPPDLQDRDELDPYLRTTLRSWIRLTF